jgi:hypothetical protein
MPFNIQDIATGIILSAILWAANRVRKLFLDVDIAFQKIRALEKELDKK